MNCKLPQIHHKLETISSELKCSGWNEVWKTKNKIHYDVETEEISEEFEVSQLLTKIRQNVCWRAVA